MAEAIVASAIVAWSAGVAFARPLPRNATQCGLTLQSARVIVFRAPQTRLLDGDRRRHTWCRPAFWARRVASRTNTLGEASPSLKPSVTYR